MDLSDRREAGADFGRTDRIPASVKKIQKTIYFHRDFTISIVALFGKDTDYGRESGLTSVDWRHGAGEEIKQTYSLYSSEYVVLKSKGTYGTEQQQWLLFDSRMLPRFIDHLKSAYNKLSYVFVVDDRQNFIIADEYENYYEQREASHGHLYRMTYSFIHREVGVEPGIILWFESGKSIGLGAGEIYDILNIFKDFNLINAALSLTAIVTSAASNSYGTDTNECLPLDGELMERVFLSKLNTAPHEKLVAMAQSEGFQLTGQENSEQLIAMLAQKVKE